MPVDLKKLAVIAHLMKSVDVSALAKAADDLREVDDIVGVNDSRAAMNNVPSGAELLTGAPVAAHGADASTQIARHLQAAPQEGITRMYQELAGRLGGLEKAVKAIVDVFAKANEDEEKANSDEDEVGKSLRKGRIAVRKAESADDEEGDEMCAKAADILKAVNDAISKAEDDAMDDKDEEKVEKARSELNKLRASLKALTAKRETAKALAAAPAVVEAAVTTTPAVKADADPALQAFADLAKGKGITVAELFETVKAAGNAGPAINTPPVFTKAAAANPGAFAVKADKAFREKLITDHELSRAKSIIGRIGAVAAGLMDESIVRNEIATLPSGLRDVFAVA